MRIEALAPLKLRLSENDVHESSAGETLELSPDIALKLFSKAAGKVWALPAGEDWLSQWRALATSTLGFTRTDQRYQPIMQILEECDRHYINGNQAEFKTATARLRDAI